MALARRYRRRHRVRRRIFRERIDPMADDDLYVFSRYRFHKQTIMFIVNLIAHLITPICERSFPVPPTLQVLVTLRFLASGSHYRLVGDSLGLSVATVSRCVSRVTKALCSLAPRLIKFPNGVDAEKEKQAFYRIAGFPNVISAVDGTFIRILAPNDNEQDFVNRKGFHALNVQMSCDSRFRITNCVSKWPGSVHDARIFRESQLCRSFENGSHDGLLLGDSGYPCRPFLMTPYNSTRNNSQIRFNNSLCRTRVLIEQTFGILKRRFSCLHSCLRVKPTKAAIIVVACAVLHNVGIQEGDILPPEEEEVNEGPVHQVPLQGDGEAIRNHICANHFS